jgi:hypothetical protein
MTQPIEKPKPANAVYHEYVTRTLVCQVWAAPPNAEPSAKCVITSITPGGKR